MWLQLVDLITLNAWMGRVYIGIRGAIMWLIVPTEKMNSTVPAEQVDVITVYPVCMLISFVNSEASAAIIQFCSV